jgi:hypothetical protein
MVKEPKKGGSTSRIYLRINKDAPVAQLDRAPWRENTAFWYSFSTVPSRCAYPPDHRYLQEAFDADKLQFFSSHQARQDAKVVTRGELRQALWPEDTFVDFELGVNTAVKKLRQALEDSADHPKFIETLPRYGYRFMIPVEWMTGYGDKISPLQPTGHRDHHPNWLKVGAGILLGAILAVAFVFAYIRWRPSADQSPLTSLPITELPGLEVAPTFSPDVTRIAFAWCDPASGSKGFDLYSVVGSENMVRLTHYPSQWITPAWSPDGTQIAFHRISGADTGLYLVPALGGPERKLRI